MTKQNRDFYTERFTKLYETLNPAQKLAVDTVEGPVLVVAGPGTGKTQVLSARIANIIKKTDAAANNILALTFTESAAKNMQERVVSMIGKDGYYVEITTFHAFCASVITAYPEYFPVSRDSQALTDVELFQTMQQVIDELELETLKPLNAPHFYLKEAVRAISQLKREGLTPERYAALVAQIYADENLPEKKVAASKFLKDKSKNTELAKIFAAYQHKLLELKRYDFDDMIMFVIEAFQQQESLLLEYQERFHYFLVDEYQDTNTAQNQVVQLLASYWEDRANIFVVGDPHQSIYRFQGASTENVLEFTKQYPKAAVITLDTSYRCPQEITNVAHSLISNNTLTQSVPDTNPALQTLHQAMTAQLTAVHTVADAVQVWEAPSQTVELIQVAEKIQQLLATGVAAEEIAVLYRTNKESVAIGEVLEKWEIPYELDGGTNLFEFVPIMQLLQLFEVIELSKTQQADARLFEVLCYEWIGLPTLSVYKFSQLAGRERKTLYELVALSWEELQQLKPDLFTQVEHDQFVAFFKKIEHWIATEKQSTFVDWFEQVVQESGYLAWITKQPTVVEQLLYLNTLRQQVKTFCTERDGFGLTQFLQTIETMQSYGIPLIAQDLNIRKGAVHLSTVHKAKGQEWQYVFIVNCIDGVWGNTRERNLLPLPAEILQSTDVSKKEKNEDDRRLLYVAITRAKHQVCVSYPNTLESGAVTKNVNPSMFLAEFAQESEPIASQQDLSVLERQEELLLKLVTPASPVAHTQQVVQYFTQLVSQYKLSVSGLNRYLQDPTQFILQDLLLLPSGNAPYLAFGTAMHAALELLFKQLISGAPIDAQKVFECYDERLKKEVLLYEDYQRRLVYGKQVLQQYLESLQPESLHPWQVEARFGSNLRKTVLQDIPLVGRIDRLDWIEKNKTVRVIDYKTGSAKTKNTLEGKTQSAGLSERELQLAEGIRSPFKRQLLFYKLLSELDVSFKPKVIQGVFEFVVPDSKSGAVISHAFELPDSEVVELSELIQEVMQEIRALDFLQYLPQAISTVESQSK